MENELPVVSSVASGDYFRMTTAEYDIVKAAGYDDADFFMYKGISGYVFIAVDDYDLYYALSQDDDVFASIELDNFTYLKSTQNFGGF